MRQMFSKLICVGVIFILVTAMISFTATAMASSNSVNIFPPGGNPYGIPYAEHIKNFWKWLIKIPLAATPRNDPTGERCITGQENSNSSVFYLSPNSGGKSQRTCIVPAGKGLFIPVMQVEVSDKELPGASIEELAESAKKDQDSVNALYLKIGDKEYNYETLTKYRTRTDGFEVVFPDNAIFDVKQGGVAKSVADGFYIVTEPLAKGNYLIHFKSSLTSLTPAGITSSFAQDIQYNIIAK
jgi:hypothetical protein